MSTVSPALTAHPYADAFPLLVGDEMDGLVESIRASGLRQPVVVTPEGLILDGRNRAAACALVGIEPETVVYDGEDLAEYVIDSNVTRRNMSTGARAMATAVVLAADGRREDGRWRRGSVAIGASPNSGTWRAALADAGVVLDFTPDVATAVINGEMPLKTAFALADAFRTSADSDRIQERERKRREKELAAAEAEKDSRIVTDLTQAASKYLALIESDAMTPAAAWAAHLEDTRKERRNEDELDQGRRSGVTRIAECVRFLDGGAEQAAIFLRDQYPHETRFLAEGMYLTRDRLNEAIAFLTTVREGVQP